MGYESMEVIAFRMGAFGFWLAVTHTSRSLELRNVSTATGVTSAKARRVMIGAASPSIEASELGQVLPFAAARFSQSGYSVRKLDTEREEKENAT
ncbi:hypothetical protein JQ616_35555 [Bradyrhizobium tropiciagri]|uniref:hypothetical protein n=1 Tax=Bradyrhizobium tropiciagri TaxID=312253 RepID=UPI001BA88082|nr:hypothetical protein [Bradyrhizobium tropiciagri]MBR0900296.1 hypothetical protein [Bradyrhizobium tropiciagri]